MADHADIIARVTAVLDDNRLASLATVSADGWPHCTMVGFANEGLRLYFLIASGSQKMADLEGDGRISLAIGRDVIDPKSIRALAIKARAMPVEDSRERTRALELLLRKRPALRRLREPTQTRSRLIVAIPEEIRLLDYSQGFGRSTLLRLDPDGRLVMAEDEYHDWGYGRG